MWPHIFFSFSSPFLNTHEIYARIAEVVVGDETGIISLRARDHQVDFLLRGIKQKEAQQEEDFVIVVRNAGVAMFKGYMRLIVNKWGKLSR